MEVRLLNTDYVPNGWFTNQLNTFWRDFAREAAQTPAEQAFIPAADVVEDTNGYHLYFEMAGMKSDSVDVRVEDGQLAIEAERARPEWPKDAQIHLSERVYGKMVRRFRLPEDTVNDGISASYTDGILHVTVPKKPETKPVRIKVTS